MVAVVCVILSCHNFRPVNDYGPTEIWTALSNGHSHHHHSSSCLQNIGLKGI